MSSVSEWIAREYFEMLGCMVSQPCKYSFTRSSKKGEEDTGLFVVNPSASRHILPDTTLWTSKDIGGVKRAVVGVCGWHTDRIYSAILDRSPEMLRFMSGDAMRFSAERMGSQEIAKILCLPQLPVSKKLQQQILATLKEKGVDGVLLFRTMLSELSSRVDTNRNYDKSDLLQIIRILKNYNMLKDPQLELFEPRKKRS
jgi:hypothetical protein